MISNILQIGGVFFSPRRGVLWRNEQPLYFETRPSFFFFLLSTPLLLCAQAKMSAEWPWKGKLALVTGASVGIGVSCIFCVCVGVVLYLLCVSLCVCVWVSVCVAVYVCVCCVYVCHWHDDAHSDTHTQWHTSVVRCLSVVTVYSPCFLPSLPPAVLIVLVTYCECVTFNHREGKREGLRILFTSRLTY